jgi:ABC-type branched-subunit amino acid transport system substrate-binding protein
MRSRTIAWGWQNIRHRSATPEGPCVEKFICAYQKKEHLPRFGWRWVRGLQKKVRMTEASIKVGMIAEQTGALAFMGGANANVAKMVVGDPNSKGGLLGRTIELYLEDGATTDSVAETKATKLVEEDKVDVIFGGIYSSTRQAIKAPPS